MSTEARKQVWVDTSGSVGTKIHKGGQDYTVPKGKNRLEDLAERWGVSVEQAKLMAYEYVVTQIAGAKVTVEVIEEEEIEIEIEFEDDPLPEDDAVHDPSPDLEERPPLQAPAEDQGTILDTDTPREEIEEKVAATKPGRFRKGKGK